MKTLKDIKHWEEMKNQIICADCLEGMKLIPDKSVDLVLTDPPYDMDLKGGMKSKIMSMNKYKGKELEDIVCSFDIEKVFAEYKRILKKFNMFCFCSNKQVSEIMRWGEDKGYIVNLLVWNKTNAPPFANGVWKSDLEFCVHIRESGAVFQGEAKVKSKLYQSPVVSEKFHPTTKPLELISRYIEIGSNEGDVVLDPFMGSWTTARACKDLGRDFIGFELSEEYCKIGEQRLRQEVMF
jgi:site-specific DNA-methyltransferase (adenine-specific)